MFTVTLDFGNQFPGADRWLQIEVRTNGGGAFAALSPRQRITATPYAIQAGNAVVAASAGSVNAANISGTIPLAQLPAGVVTNGASGVNFTGSFTGNGVGMTNVLLTTLNAPGVLSWPGNFTLNSSPDVGNVPRSLVSADVNGDGKLDLISANNGASTLTVLTNAGRGSFGLAATYSVGSNTRSVATADVNGDGKADLICSSSSPGALIVLTNVGNGSFVAASTNSTGPGAGNVQMVFAADINGDTKPDLISANGNSPGSLSVFTNNGSGGFSLASSNGVGNNPFAVTVADVNGDIFPDLISANNITSGTLSVLLNNGSGAFLPAISYSTGTSPRSVVAADVNGDNFPDLISANSGSSSLSVLLNDGSGAFPVALPIPAGTSPLWVTAVELNGDGKVDLVCANNTIPGTLTAVTNIGGGSFAPAFTSSVGNLPFAVIAADVNADGQVDLVSANGTSPGTLSVLFNLPSFNGTFTGNGLGLSALNASQLTSGQVPLAVLGNAWQITGNSGTTPGTHFLGTTDNQPLELRVNGARALRLEPSVNNVSSSNLVNVVGGSPDNFVSLGIRGATISGGGALRFNTDPAMANSIKDDLGTIGGGAGNSVAVNARGGTIAGGIQNWMGATYATIAGGFQNTNSGQNSAIGGGYQNVVGDTGTVAGGQKNAATGFAAAVGGGVLNTAGGDRSFVGCGWQNNVQSQYGTISGGSLNSISLIGGAATIGGGSQNFVSGFFATVPGGLFNTANGDFSFAAGRQAKVQHQSSFVWADSPGGNGLDFSSTSSNQFLIRASGGVGIGTNNPVQALHVIGNILASGTITGSSDRNVKENFAAVNPRDVLDKVAALPISRWNYKTDSAVTHLGPMAQDFHAAFSVGMNETTISMVDADGVALAAIQGLNEKLEARSQKLEQENAELKARLEKLEALMEKRDSKNR
jgi:hypothetical protein